MIYPKFLNFRVKMISMICSTTSTLLIISSRSHLTSAKPTTSFIELTKTPDFVDKTDLLGAILEPRRNIFISSPTGFLKTSNLQMLRSFLQLEFDTNNEPKNFTDTETFTFFSHFKIAKGAQNVVQNHMATYPVLFIDLKFNLSQITRSIKDVGDLLNAKLLEAYQEYDQILTKLPPPLGKFNLTQDEIAFMENLKHNKPSENRFEIFHRLQNLCSILYKYFRRPVFILIDNYDYAANEIVLRRYDFVNTESSVHSFYVYLNEMLCRAVKDDQEFESYAIVTGLSGYIAFADRYSGKNAYFLNRNQSSNLFRYFSFDEREVDELLTRYRCEIQEIQDVKKYYKGHLKGTYNPYSIKRYLESNSTNQGRKLEPHWAQIASKEIIKQGLKSNSFREKVQILVDDRSATVNFTIFSGNETEYAALDILYRKATEIESFEGIWQFDVEYLFRYLHEIGCFNLESESSPEINLYRIPNEEMYEALRDLLASVEVPKNETVGIGNYSSEATVTQLFDDLSEIV